MEICVGVINVGSFGFCLWQPTPLSCLPQVNHSATEPLDAPQVASCMKASLLAVAQLCT